MTSTNRAEGASALLREVRRWIRAEEENRELGERVSSALEEIKVFLAERRADLERRKGRVLQTSGFKEETLAMEAALANIEQLFAGSRNISRIFADIDKYLKKHKVGDTLSRSYIRGQLAEARDEFMCAFQDSITGTKLSELLEILYFIPFSCWRLRGLERKNYRSPSEAEVLKLLEELERRGFECGRIDTVQLAAMIRIQLGITPRMNYHNMTDSKLAELLTSGDNFTRFISKVTPPDEVFCRAAGTILKHLRRWSAELFAGTGLIVPAEIEAEMLQMAFLAPETVFIGGPERERATDYLWLLATVIASDHVALKDTLSWPTVQEPRFASVRERILGAKTTLDRIAVVADRILAARWVETREELVSLSVRSEAISAKAAHGFGDVKELEQLKEKRSDVGKALIKISDSLQLVELTLLDIMSAAGQPSGLPAVDEHVQTLYPSALISRNRAYAEDTKRIARQELDKLRALIERIGAISRNRFAAAAAEETPGRRCVPAMAARATSDGTEIGTLSAAEVQALLLGALREAVAFAQDSSSRVEGARKRVARADLLHALNVLNDKLKRAGEAGGRILSEAVDALPAPVGVTNIAALLRECLTAQTTFSARVSSAKLTPAEKSPLTSILYAMRTKLRNSLRDIEVLSSELVERGEGGGSSAPRAGAEEPPAGSIAGHVAAANRALKPVKENIAALGKEMSEASRETAAVLAATRGLKDSVAGAQRLIDEKRALVEGDELVGRFERWQLQLEAIDAEVERLLQATECLAEIEESVRAATAIGGKMPDQRPPGVEAVETIGRALERLPHAREVCAAASQAKWRALKGASAFLQSSVPTLDASKAMLERIRSRITPGAPSA